MLKRDQNFWRLFRLAALGLLLCLPAAASVAQDSNRSVAFSIEDLTQEERDWLKANPVLRIGIDNAWPPLEFVNASGNYSGVAADFLKIIENRLGLTFEFEKDKPWPVIVEMMKAGELDALSLVVKTPQRETYLEFTESYLSFPYVIVSKGDQAFIDGIDGLFGKKIGVVESYAIHDLLVRNHPDLNLILSATVESGLASVLTGESDAFIGNLGVISQVMRNAGMTQLEISGQTTYRSNLSMAFRKDLAAGIPIFNKVLASINSTERHEIKSRWVHLRFDDVVDLDTLIVVLAVGAAIIVIIVAWNRTLRLEINRRKRVEANLRESEFGLARAQHIARIGSWDLDIDSGKLNWSDEVFELFGLSKEKFDGTTASFYACVHPDDHERVRQITLEATEALLHHEFQHRIILPDGRERIIHERIEIECDESGRAIAFHGTAQDVTESVETEAALWRSETWLRAILLNAPIEIVLKDTQGQVLACSKSAADVLDIEIDDVLGGASSRFLPSRIASDTFLRDHEVLETGQEIELEFSEETGGRTRHLQRSSFPLREESGEIIGVCSLTTDVTQAKTAEQALRQMQKLEAVGQLTGGIAHDFNNLLSIVIGNAELLEDVLEDAGARRLLRPIAKAAERGSELTTRLLSFARQQSLSPTITDVAKLCENMIELLERTLGATITIELQREEQTLAIVDPGQLESALLNLVLNARDAMPQGGHLIISVGRTEIAIDELAESSDLSTGHYIILEVKDNGTGIAEGVLDHVFEPFFTTKEVGHGSGLGLSMVYGFAKQSHGQLKVASKEDQGTTVTLYLPVAESDSLQETQDPANRGSAAGGRETILIIEDEPELRALTAHQLDLLGYRTLLASNGSEALDLLAGEETIDLVLSDVILPGGMSGPDIYRAIEKSQPDLKFLWMSGHPVAPNSQGELLENLLRKPFTRNELANAIRARLEEREAERRNNQAG